MRVDPRLAPVESAFKEMLAADETYSAQLAIYHRDELVLDLVGGPELVADSLVPVFSSSKGVIATVIGHLLEQGLIDLDATVASYWPEFAARGKGNVLVRQLLSHQAGLLGLRDGYTDDELLAHTPLASRLAASLPLWVPGQAFAYHALTIGVLADELVRRITGKPLASVYRTEIAEPRGIDFHLGVGPDLDSRVVSIDMPTAEELLLWLDKMPLSAPGTLGALAAPVSERMLLTAVNDEDFRRAGTPAAGGLATAAGLARLYAAIAFDLGGGPILSAQTIETMTQIHVSGVDIASQREGRFAITYQVPHGPRLEFGTARAFGHDGAGGSLAFHDPAFAMSFGYLTKRIPMPGGADARAIELAKIARGCLA